MGGFFRVPGSSAQLRSLWFFSCVLWTLFWGKRGWGLQSGHGERRVAVRRRGVAGHGEWRSAIPRLGGAAGYSTRSCVVVCPGLGERESREFDSFLLTLLGPLWYLQVTLRAASAESIGTVLRNRYSFVDVTVKCWCLQSLYGKQLCQTRGVLISLVYNRTFNI